MYRLGVGVAAISNPKAKSWIKGRRNIFSRIAAELKDADNVVWFHCASLGEYEQGKPVMAALKKENPEHTITGHFLFTLWI